jgi:hypothetical protein
MFDASELQQLLQEADQAFLQSCDQRMQLGEQQYGPYKFLGVDTLQEAIDEVVDLVNYGRMTFIKLYLLQASLKKIEADHPAIDKSGFVPMKEFLQS